MQAPTLPPAAVQPPITRDTARLRMRQWRKADRAPFAALNADPRVMEHFPSTMSCEASDAMVDRLAAQIETRGWGLWAVEVIDSGAFIGFVGLQIPAATLPFSPCVEIGWRLAKEHWGQGYATEAARAALQVGFEPLGLQEIVSFTALRNTRSRAVMARLGMRQADFTFEHPSVPEGHHLREHCLYRMARTDWVAQPIAPA